MIDPIARIDGIMAELAEIRAGLVREGWPDRRPAAANDDDDPVVEKARELRQACADLGIVISPDNFVGEADAAQLLGKATQTLRNWRSDARPLLFRKNRGAIEYSLCVLATFLVEAEKNPD